MKKRLPNLSEIIGMFISMVALTWSANAYSQTCIGQPNYHLITQYGTFIPALSDAATINTNNTTINNAVVTLGKAGGGIIGIPAGTFYIGPDPTKADRAVTIAYDNITICGAGIGSTILKTNGTWNASRNRRGHGIIIQGTSSSGSPRKNIVLKDFELDGQAGWTGNYNWTNPATDGPNGWDISHKGIVPAWDANTHNVTLENLYVHHFRGEILYVGGYGMGKLTVRNVKMAETNGSDFNLYADDLLVENCEFAGPSRFWIEFSPRQSSVLNSKNTAVFRNNIFKDAKLTSGGSIVFAQGDFNTYSITFDQNTISNAQSAFAFYGGVKGPVSIINNKISNLWGNLIEFSSVDGYINSNNNANITVENNTITKGGFLANIFGPAENVMIRNNNFAGISSSNPNSSTAIKYASGPLKNIRIDGNIFKDCRTPEEEWAWAFVGERPLFKNNSYTNCLLQQNQAIYTINSSAPLATPHYEHVQVYTSTPNFIAQLETKGYPAGQNIAVTGGSNANPVRFATGQASYTVTQNRYLNGTNTLYFNYDISQKKWIEGITTSVNPKVVMVENITISPNPANQLTFVSYLLLNNNTVKISVCDMLGRELMQVVNENQLSGEYKLSINTSQLQNGIYFVRMNVNEEQQTQKIIINQ